MARIVVTDYAPFLTNSADWNDLFALCVKGGAIGLLKNPWVRKAPKFFRRIPYQFALASNILGHAVVCHSEYRQIRSAILGAGTPDRPFSTGRQ